MPDCLPGIRCLDLREASTLVVTMADHNTGLEVDLVYGKKQYHQSSSALLLSSSSSTPPPK